MKRTLEEVIINAKKEIMKRLKEKEIEKNEYFDMLKNYFKNEGLDDEYGIRLGASLASRKLEIHIGLEKTYYSLPHVKLSEESKRDITKLDEIKKSALKYIKAKYSKKIPEEKVEEAIEDYLYHGNVPYELNDYERLNAKYSILYAVKDQFKIIKKNKDPFDKLIDKIL